MENNENVKVTKFNESTVPQNFSLLAKSNGWDINTEETEWWAKVVFSGITDFLNLVKAKDTPKAVLIQDLKGNRIVVATVQWIPAEDENETATGNWTYFWSFDCDNIAEGTTVYTLDQESVQSVISKRGYDMCKMSFATTSVISQLAVYLFNLIKDTLDQQAVEENSTWVLELDGYFEASVEVVNGNKEFAILPAGEMKTLIKDDAGNEK